MFEHSSDYGVVWPVPRGRQHGHGERPLKSVHAVHPSLLVIPSLPTGPIIVFRSSQPAASLVIELRTLHATRTARSMHASSVMFSLLFDALVGVSNPVGASALDSFEAFYYITEYISLIQYRMSVMCADSFLLSVRHPQFSPDVRPLCIRA